MTQMRKLLTSKEWEYQVNFANVVSEELHCLRLETKLEQRDTNLARMFSVSVRTMPGLVDELIHHT